jgi:hypothetical protein
MTPFLEAGNLSWVTWTHVWVAMAILHLYIGGGVWWALRIKRERDARLGLATPGRGGAIGAPRRSPARWLDDLYGLTALRSRASRALAALRMRPSFGLRRALARDERASAA